MGDFQGSDRDASFDVLVSTTCSSLATGIIRQHLIHRATRPIYILQASTFSVIFATVALSLEPVVLPLAHAYVPSFGVSSQYCLIIPKEAYAQDYELRFSELRAMILLSISRGSVVDTSAPRPEGRVKVYCSGYITNPDYPTPSHFPIFKPLSLQISTSLPRPLNKTLDVVMWECRRL